MSVKLSVMTSPH